MRSTVKEKHMQYYGTLETGVSNSVRGGKQEKRHQLAGVFKDELMFAGGRGVIPGRGHGMTSGPEL